MTTGTVENRIIDCTHTGKKSMKISGRAATYLLIPLAIFVFSLTLMSCGKGTDSPQQPTKKLKVVTTLFPVYDFSKNVGGKFAEVSLILPPGTEAHTFEPRPADMTRINNADLFIYTTLTMEPWVPGLLKGIDSQRLTVIEAGSGLEGSKHQEEHESATHDKHAEHDSHQHEAHGVDPHVWLDFDNAIRMTETIVKGFIDRDPKNRDYYLGNASLFISKLKAIDDKYRSSLAECNNRFIVHAGHFAFGYLAKRYNIGHISAYKGFSPNAEPTPKDLARLSKTVKKKGLKYVFVEELITPTIGEAISRETGVEMLLLHGAHNISKSELDSGVTFLYLMDANLENLRKGLQCQ
jgi:zinc transport system substrate-binding protein